MVAMREISPLLGVALFTDSEQGGRYYRDRIAPAFDRLREIVLENLPTYDHRNFDPELLVRVTIGMCWILAIDERFARSDRYREADVARELTALVFDGIIARQTHEPS
jgi:hypothetical protein